MLNFYTFPEAVRIMFSVLTIINAGFAALVFILHQYRLNRGTSYWLNSAAAFLVICQALIYAALIAQVQYNITDGFIVVSGYIIARYVVFAAIAAIFLFLYNIKEKSLLPGIVLAASFLTLPFMETWTGSFFPVVFSSALAILLVSGVWHTVKIRGELATSISGLSIKEAMDSLDTAILFYKKNGHILMLNGKMQELMIKTTGRVLYNGRIYFETMVIPNAQPRKSDSYLYKLPDSEWLFTIREIKAGRKYVIQLTATNVTEQSRETILLQEKRRELEDREKQLKDLVQNIEKICRAENLLRIKIRLHDAQNTKLTTLLQYIRYGELPAGESFDSLNESVLRHIKEPEAVPADPDAELSAIITQYMRKGVKIKLTNSLPPEQEIALLFVQILQEAAANAVLHGYANEVNVWIMYGDGKYTMRVSDNGARLLIKIKEGSGIKGMRQRAEKLGGNLYVDTLPRFTLIVSIPMKEGEIGE